MFVAGTWYVAGTRKTGAIRARSGSTLFHPDGDLSAMGTKKLWIWTGVIVGLIVIAVGWNLFAPEGSTQVDQAFDPGQGPAASSDDGQATTEDPGNTSGPDSAGSMENESDGSGSAAGDRSSGQATALKTGTFQGADRYHHVSGTVTLYRLDDGSHLLRFEDYEATDGPDVYVYLTPGGPEGSDVEGDGLKVLVPGGGEDGQATLRGNFSVPLPGDVDPDDWSGVAIWCEDFNVLFGGAELTAAA